MGAPSFPPVFIYLSLHFARELRHDCFDPHGSQAPHPNVLPSKPPLFHGYLLLLCHCSSDNGCAVGAWGSFILCTLCCSVFPVYFFGSIDCYLLALMAYDRYVAVCQPLLYVTIMTQKALLSFVAGAYIAGLLSALVRTISAFTLSFCGNNEIDFIFCDLPPLLKLTCGESYIQELVIIVFAIFVIPACMVVIVVSYLFIIVAILRIPSAGGRAKTFSTCASHLTAVSLFFGTLIFMYLRDNSGQASEKDRVVSVFYTTVIPMLNPLIYSLRNKEVKEALKNFLNRVKTF